MLLMTEILVEVAALEARLPEGRQQQAQCVLSPGWQSHSYFTTPVADITNGKVQWGDEAAGITPESSPRKPLCALLMTTPSRGGISQVAKFWFQVSFLVDGKAITEIDVPLKSLRERAPRQLFTIRARDELKGILLLLKVAWSPAPTALRKHAVPMAGTKVKVAQAIQQRPRSAPGRRRSCRHGVSVGAAVKEVDEQVSASKRMHARCSCGLGIEAAETMAAENGRLRSVVVMQGDALRESRTEMEKARHGLHMRPVADWLLRLQDK